jgi:hypothetical protein
LRQLCRRRSRVVGNTSAFPSEESLACWGYSLATHQFLA